MIQKLGKMRIGSKVQDKKHRGNQLEMISHGGKPFAGCGTTSRDGTPFPTVGHHFHGGLCCLSSLQTPIHRGGGLPSPPQRWGQYPYGWVSGGYASRKYQWKLISHRGTWFLTVENDFPPWKIDSHHLPPSVWPYVFDPINNSSINEKELDSMTIEIQDPVCRTLDLWSPLQNPGPRIKDSGSGPWWWRL